MSTEDHELRREIIETCIRLETSGLNQGQSGNVSVRTGSGHLLITPSGIAYNTMQPEDIVSVEISTGGCVGDRRPSTELPLHLAIMRARSDAGAIIHAHAEHATAVACLGRGLPAIHYLVGLFGGNNIRCAPYAKFGTVELSRNVVAALEGRRGALMANHGLVVLGRDIAQAFDLTREAETIAKTYLRALAAGAPVILSDEEMDCVVERFRQFGYGPLTN